MLLPIVPCSIVIVVSYYVLGPSVYIYFFDCRGMLSLAAMVGDTKAWGVLNSMNDNLLVHSFHDTWWLSNKTKEKD